MFSELGWIWKGAAVCFKVLAAILLEGLGETTTTCQGSSVPVLILIGYHPRIKNNPYLYMRGVRAELTDKIYLSDVSRQVTTFRKKPLPLSSRQKYVGRDKMVVTRESMRREATLLGQMGVHGLEMGPAWPTSFLKNEPIDTSETFQPSSKPHGFTFPNIEMLVFNTTRTSDFTRITLTLRSKPKHNSTTFFRDIYYSHVQHVFASIQIFFTELF